MLVYTVSMKIILYKENRHVVMRVASDKLDQYVGENYERWDEFIVDLANELDGRPGVKRKSYDTWWWDERKEQEAEEYITYFYLKHGK